MLSKSERVTFLFPSICLLPLPWSHGEQAATWKTQATEVDSRAPTYVESDSRPLSALGATAALLGRRAAIMFTLETMEVATVTARCRRCVLFKKSKA